MEPGGGGFQGPCEPPAGSLGKMPKGPDQREQGADDEVPEDHMEQELFIGPPSPVGTSTHIVRGGVRHQLVKRDAGPLELIMYGLTPQWLDVHVPVPGPLSRRGYGRQTTIAPDSPDVKILVNACQELNDPCYGLLGMSQGLPLIAAPVLSPGASRLLQYPDCSVGCCRRPSRADG
jgi:hypothetical protein